MSSKTIDLSQVSADELEQLLEQKREEENNQRLKKREAYEGIRAEVLHKIETKVRQVTDDVRGLFNFVSGEAEAFKSVMAEYGMLKRNGQLSFTLKSKKFKMEVKTSRVKKFDERADVAASRLIEFLEDWIKRSDKGVDDPMYQLAMTLLERNKYGDLDYKSVSKLYDLEEKFNNAEYSEIMKLFKESNEVEGTITNFYFYEKTDRGVWLKIEPSFNRL